SAMLDFFSLALTPGQKLFENVIKKVPICEGVTISGALTSTQERCEVNRKSLDEICASFIKIYRKDKKVADDYMNYLLQTIIDK
ncbi:hypothetical protein ACFL29_01065, partial [Patescibacteria group bacterium]